MKQRWAVQNHIQTVHAIAVCNLVEMTMGIVAESTIPPHLRWLPMGMDISYLKKATGQLHGVSNIDPETFFTLPQYPGEVKVPVEVKNNDGVVVSKAEVIFDLAAVVIAIVCNIAICLCETGSLVDFQEACSRRQEIGLKLLLVVRLSVLC